MSYRISEDGQRPMRRLFKCLPTLPLNSDNEIDFQAADPALLVMLADDAQTTTRVIQQGVGAIGHLLAQSGVAIEEGAIDSSTVESLGYFLAEISDLSIVCRVLACKCRRETVDYQPAGSSPID